MLSTTTLLFLVTDARAKLAASGWPIKRPTVISGLQTESVNLVVLCTINPWRNTNRSSNIQYSKVCLTSLNHFLTGVGDAPLLVSVRFLLERCFGLLIHPSPLLAQHLADLGDLHVGVLGLDLVV